MAPPAKLKIARLVTAPIEPTASTPLPGRERQIPNRFEVLAELDEPPCVVRLEVVVEDRQPVVHELAVGRTGPPWGPPVTASTIRRIALDALLRSAVDDIAVPSTAVDLEGVAGVGHYSGDNAGEVWVSPVARPLTGPGRRTPDEVLQRVASVYRAAAVPGGAPTQAVADELHISRSHAGRLVGQARTAGHLAPTTPGKAGEQP